MATFNVKKNSGNIADGVCTLTLAAGTTTSTLKAGTTFTYQINRNAPQRTVFSTATDIAANPAGTFAIPDQSYPTPGPGITIPAAGGFGGGTYRACSNITLTYDGTNWTVNGTFLNITHDEPTCDWGAGGSGAEETDSIAGAQYSAAV